MHHIVPLSRGGNDIPSNIVLLCTECHGKAHDITLRNLVTEKQRYPGRKKREKPENFDLCGEKYLKGEIGRKEFLETCNMHKSYLSPNCKCTWWPDFLKAHRIASFKNNVDLIEYQKRRGWKATTQRVEITYEV